MLPQLLRERDHCDRAVSPVDAHLRGSQSHTTNSIQHQLTTETKRQQVGVAWHDTRTTGSVSHTRIKVEKFKQATWGHKLESYSVKATGKSSSIPCFVKIQIAQELFFHAFRRAVICRTGSQILTRSEAQTGSIVGPVGLSTPHQLWSRCSLCRPVGSTLASGSLGRMASDCTTGKFWRS